MFKEIECKLHGQYLQILNIYRFVKTDAFRHAYNIANDSEKITAKDLINNHNQSALNTWTESILKKYKEYEYINVRDLRDMVMELGYSGYNKMVRLEMISLLTKKK